MVLFTQSSKNVLIDLNTDLNKLKCISFRKENEPIAAKAYEAKMSTLGTPVTVFFFKNAKMEHSAHFRHHFDTIQAPSRLRPAPHPLCAKESTVYWATPQGGGQNGAT